MANWSASPLSLARTPSAATRRTPPRRTPNGSDICRTIALVFGLFACSGTDPTASPAPPALSALPPLPERPSDHPLPRGEERPTRELTLAFVGEVRGEIEPCGCPTLPYGGFERRERLLDQLRERETLVHLDAGELLVKGLVTTTLEERSERARAVLRLSQDVGVQAWAPGPTDLLALGVDGLMDVANGRVAGPPPVSATWRLPGNKPFLPAARVVEVDGLRVGVIGLSAPPSAPEVAAAIEWVDPVEATRAALETLPADLDLVVGLGTLADAEADRIARAIPRLGALLTTRGVQADPPRQVELPAQGPLIVESTDRGRYLTVVRTRLGSDGRHPLVAHPARHTWKTWRTTRSQVTALRALPEATGEAPVPRTLEDEGPDPARLAAAEAQLADQTEQIAAEGRGRNLAYVASIPLAEDLDGTSRIAREVQAVKDALIERADDRARSEPPPLTPTFASSSGCVTCHVAEFARWAHSDHARAWESLAIRRETDNPECVGCHSTGFGQPGGFGELTSANVGRFKAVQCEACHGPMAGHPGDARVAPRPITPERCQACHDPANSPDFDFQIYLARATCQGGAPEVMPSAP